VIVGFGLRGELPSPSTSLSLPLPFLLSPARAPCAPLVASRPAALRAPAALALGGPIPRPRALATAPSRRPRALARPHIPGGRALPRRAPHIPARVTVVARCLTFGLVDVLRRALRRTMIYFKFAFIHVLRPALRRATIHFNFRLFNVWRRVSSRATFRFKFSLDDVCRHALRRATLDVIFIINSSVSWHTPSRDESFYF
jgi:hypothetical protein